MKPIKNLRAFVQSLRRSCLFGKIQVVDGLVVASCVRDYFVTRDILLSEYLDRVASLSTSQADENICINVKFY